MTAEQLALLRGGTVIPAHPLALDRRGKMSEPHQRALTRYYVASGAGGIAVGVHTTQFEIRKPEHGLYRPVLELAAETAGAATGRPFLKIAGICGPTHQAIAEATTAVELGYDLGLLSLGGLGELSEEQLLEHAAEVGQAIPLFGFYLQPAVGGRLLSYGFWRRFAQIESVLAIKIAPFNRYQTLDVVRGVLDSGRADEISLYTGNDDAIVADLVTPMRVSGGQASIVGGLLGQFAVWTNRAVELLERIKRQGATAELLAEGMELTDVNSALFDAAGNFAGSIAGIHEVLHRQGLLPGTWCLEPHEVLSPGQRQEIDRVLTAYPHLNDDSFVQDNLDEWLS